jgi:kynurenine formamidase
MALALEEDELKIVDLSHLIESSPDGVPEFLRTEVSYTNHEEGARMMEELVGVPSRLLRDGEGPAAEHLSIGTHATTHLDAPWHYNSTIGGRPAPTIDELPVEQFFGRGVVVDARHKEDGDAVTLEEMEAGIAAAGHSLAPGHIVLVHTGRDAFYGDPDYMWRGPGVSVEATRWLFDQGVRVMGIDAWGWDAPLDGQARQALERDEAGVFWAAHQCDLPYSQIERLSNLSALPPTGFSVACFPLKIKGASAAPARVVALLDINETRSRNASASR